MFATYSVPGLDIVFYCIMTALSMLTSYVFGRAHKLEKIKEEIETFKFNRTWLCKELRESEHQNRVTYAAWSNDIDKTTEVWAEALKQQKRELTKKQRLAMTKYKTKCDARLATQFGFMQSTIETIKVNNTLDQSDYKRPDFSALLSK